MYTPDQFASPPADDTVLWRYMGFTKFVSLLEKRALFFCRTDKLGDPFEGSISTATPPFIVAFRPGERRPAANKSLEAKSIDLRNVAKGTFVNCWHASDDESDAMWRLYAKYGEGVAIRTDFKRLAAAFAGERLVSIGGVEYKDYDRDHTPLDLMRLCFFKRKSFQHEQEVRAVVRHGGNYTGVGFYVEVDLRVLVSEIVVAPFAETWFFELVSTLAKRYGLTQAVKSGLSGKPVFDAQLLVLPADGTE